MIGEKTIATVLTRLDSSRYKVINNVVLNVRGRISQIDHVVISDFGIFVIETKNYKGWIMGGEYAEYWTQVIYKRKEKLYNPVRQNYGHVLALKHLLREFPYIKYLPIVVFSTKAELKVNTRSEVIYSVDLLKVIRKHTEVVLSKTEKEAIHTIITSANIKSGYKHSKHIKSINQSIKERKRLTKKKLWRGLDGT
ncbi:nuclease-related domain-containing protein [Sinomicrobium oceani]|nr:nuclease-related domain-containing protein [Sinomicrobium oceani]